VKPDAKDNIFPRKERPENKIDGPVALFMAMKLAQSGPGPSVYESRGLLEVEL
jgi:phage terminase large subunit-like protein